MNVPLALLPLVGIPRINNIRAVSFTVLNANFTSQLNSSYTSTKFYPAMWVGLDVSRYFYFSRTSIVLYGSKSEMLSIDMGRVTVSGLPDMVPGEVATVCPGLNQNDK